MQLSTRAELAPPDGNACMAACVSIPPLAAAEEAHRLDFLADQADPEGVQSHILSFFVWVFQSVLLIFAPTAPLISLADVAAPQRPEKLRQATAMFDRLAGYYGDKYRGSVILIYGLGFIAVLTALSATILPQTIRWAGVSPIVCLALEFVLLLVVLLIHLRGRSAPPGVTTGSPQRYRTHRWHERWLDYRALAERFRYAELHVTTRGPRAITDRAPADDWCTRYFQEELARAGARAGSAVYRANVLRFAIDQQQRYHHRNAHRCEVLSHRLHHATILSFFAAVAAVLIELMAEWCDMGLSSERHWIICFEYQAHFWLYATAGFPAFAAALHGIQSACEWSKLARSSTAIERALNELRTNLEALLNCSDDNLAGQEHVLNSISTRFIQVTTDELTGWRATLCDKNVPLAV